MMTQDAADMNNMHAEGENVPVWHWYVEALREKKVTDIVALDVRGLSSFADIFIVASGRSTRQVTSIGEHVVSSLKKRGMRPVGVEGLSGGRWVLIDYGDVVVHIFFEPVREFYDLEGLWSDAKRITFDD